MQPQELQVRLIRQPRRRVRETGGEVQVIQAALERNQYNRLATARALGMHKSTLFRKARLLGITLLEEDGRRHRTSSPRR